MGDESNELNLVFDLLKNQITDGKSRADVLVDRFTTLLGAVGMSMDCLSDEHSHEIVDRKKLSRVVTILLKHLDNTMNEINKELDYETGFTETGSR
ncbi:MAG: hypothetical protein MN733_03005 [Nitrososphaera sp.]|nr:hypothetical protein [Nitrososphaera sp.]